MCMMRAGQYPFITKVRSMKSTYSFESTSRLVFDTIVVVLVVGVIIADFICKNAMYVTGAFLIVINVFQFFKEHSATHLSYLWITIPFTWLDGWVCGICSGVYSANDHLRRWKDFMWRTNELWIAVGCESRYDGNCLETPVLLINSVSTWSYLRQSYHQTLWWWHSRGCVRLE